MPTHAHPLPNGAASKDDMNSPPTTDEPAGREPRPPIVLDGHWLYFAWAVWVALATLSVGLFVASVFAAYEQLSTYNGALRIVLALGYWAIGAILFRKSSGHLVALYASVALVTFGTVQADTLHWLADLYPGLDLPVALVYFVGEVFFFVLFCVFPDGRFVPRWTRWAAAVWIIYWLLDSFFPDSPLSPGNWPLVIRAPLFFALIGSLVVAQIYRYRRVSVPVEKQQTKWVVFGLTATIAAFVVVRLITWLLALTQPGIPPVLYDVVSATVISLSGLLIPLAIGFAVQRYRLWNIDRIIELSLVYSLLPVVLTAMFAITDTLLQSLFFFITGVEQSRVATYASVIVIAVAFQPLRRRIEGIVNQLVVQRIGGAETMEAH
jgi:hypothetical protein